MINGCFDLVMYRTSHLLGLNSMSHDSSHSCKVSRSAWEGFHYRLRIQLLNRLPYHWQKILPELIYFVVGRLYREGRGEAQGHGPLMSSSPPAPLYGFDLPGKH